MLSSPAGHGLPQLLLLLYFSVARTAERPVPNIGTGR
jgi:hypothetical protein